MVPSEAAGPVRCRQILVELLRPFGEQAPVWADRLVEQFGSLAAILAAAPEAQRRAVGSGSGVVRYLGVVRQAMLHALRPAALDGPVLADSDALRDYLSLAMAHLPNERARVLFLNAQNRLLADETVSHGSIRETPLYPREIMRRCLELGACALILVHNHPSGDPQPTSGDVSATRRLARIGDELDVRIHDHLIVASSGCASFRALGLL